MKENSLKKDLILKKRESIAQALKKGKRFQRGCIRLIIFPCAEKSELKIAFLVSKKLGRKAVLRNKTKRWMKEVFRISRKYFPRGTHIIMTPVVRYERLDYDSVLKDFSEVVKSEEFARFVNTIISENNIPVQNDKMSV
ncbi:MAG: ribonuclease P protein component [Candidatus Delongbacteria bacterium]